MKSLVESCKDSWSEFLSLLSSSHLLTIEVQQIALQHKMDTIDVLKNIISVHEHGGPQNLQH